jgi:hypothetical protein
MYDFSAFQSLGLLCGQVAEGFAAMQSSAEDLDARKNTNRSRFGSLTCFLRWVGSSACKVPPHLDYMLLRQFKEFLLANNAPVTAKNRFFTVTRFARDQMDRGRCAAFPLPSSVSTQASLVTASGEKTLRDLSNSTGPAHDVNEQLLKLLQRFVWHQFEAYEDRLALGRRWRQEVAGGFIAPPDASETKSDLWKAPRVDLVELAVKLALVTWSGRIPPYASNYRRLRYPDRTVPQFQFYNVTGGAGALALRHRNEPIVSIKEVLTYLDPCIEVLGCAAALLLAAGVNPSSLPRLRVDQLARDPAASTMFATIISDKPRAGRQLDLGPFPIGGPSARTLPRLWERLAAMTAGLRCEALKDIRSRLLLARGGTNNVKDTRFSIRVATSWQLQAALRNELVGHARGEFEPLQSLATSLTLSHVRTTSINVTNARLHHDFGKTAKAFRHGEGVYEASYLTGPHVRLALESHIREGQFLLEQWARGAVSIVPDDTSRIAHAAAVDTATAVRIRRDEFNLGFGVSLVNGHAIVVATPLNCARMIQWLRRLREAESRMLRDSPERWNLLYAPQLHLFREALLDFPKSVRVEGDRLDAEYQLPFMDVR